MAWRYSRCQARASTRNARSNSTTGSRAVRRSAARFRARGICGGQSTNALVVRLDAHGDHLSPVGVSMRRPTYTSSRSRWSPCSAQPTDALQKLHSHPLVQFRHPSFPGWQAWEWSSTSRRPGRWQIAHRPPCAARRASCSAGERPCRFRRAGARGSAAERPLAWSTLANKLFTTTLANTLFAAVPAHTSASASATA